MMDVPSGSNRLAKEVSPYLLQHADNPVDWYPWGDEAFEAAREQGRPIFLSIGYSTCHWCHVMARESFEDEEVAGLMNEAFVNIKVDREERPDVDSVYMQVCQMMTGQGGWPLTIVMTPEGEPFFAATYIPKVPRFGMAGMLDLVPKLASVWTEQRNDVVETAANVAREVRKASIERASHGVDSSVLALAHEQFAGRYDARHGGFGPAPKFPSPHDMMFLLRYWRSSGDSSALDMVENTLDHMRRGGIYDHVGSGFHRYSTDERWLVPHFEKMLYDQALLAMAYTEAYLATGNELYASTARDVLDYVLRDLSSPLGGFHSAEDADSEGEEGKFYLWTMEEIVDILGEDADLLTSTFNVRGGGNFRDPEGRKGLNILHLSRDGPTRSPEEVAGPLKTLMEAREGRTRPSMDDKVLTDWNGLAIAALAKASRAFGEPRYSEAAGRAVRFLKENMMTSDGRLLHRFRNGDASVPGQLDDHAFLVWGLIELYQATYDPEVLSTAVHLNRTMMEHFIDQDGSFFSTPDDGESLLFRRKEFYDGAVPSGNSVALNNLVRLSRLTGDPDLDEAASRLTSAIPRRAAHMPSGHSHLTSGIWSAYMGSWEVVIVGDLEGDARSFIDRLNGDFLPNVTSLVTVDGLVDVAEFVGPYQRVDGKAAAYLCKGGACELPVLDPEKMMERLKSDDPDA